MRSNMWLRGYVACSCYIAICIVVLNKSKNDSYNDQYTNPILLVIRKNKRIFYFQTII